jgi:dienelactone hydrolase
MLERRTDPRAARRRAGGALRRAKPRQPRGRGWRTVCVIAGCVAAFAAAASPQASAGVPAGSASTATAPPPRTLQLTLSGRQVAVDVYRPAGTPRGAVVLSHGFTRSRTTLGGHAAALAGVGVLALTPDLHHTFDFRRNAQGLAELVAMVRAGGTAAGAAPATTATGGVAPAPALGGPVDRVVLVGFSAGALSSLLAAGTPGVVGYVGLDAFDRVERSATGGGTTALGLEHARTLRTEALLLRAPASNCNAQAVSAPWGAALPALLADTVIEGATHCDFESPTDWMCRLACGAADPTRQARVRAALLQAVQRWLP